MSRLVPYLGGKRLLSKTKIDHPEVRQIFSPFRFREVTTTYQMCTRHGQGQKTQELLIANYIFPQN